VTRVLVTGARGQVGIELLRELSGNCQVVAHDRASLDLRDAAQIALRVREARPDVIVNAGAYTAVDRAESDEATARAVNGVAPGVLGEEAKRVGALLIHFSTDYVFDGTKTEPYVESDPVNPVSVYGRTKLEGERAVAQSGCRHLILRTSWVYGPHGKNFMLTMLRLAQTEEEVRVVDDQRGAPTTSIALARLVSEILGRGVEASGLYHATAAGETTWFGFAQAIFEEVSRARGSKVPRLVPISTSEYPTPAKRPAYSVLSSGNLAADLGVAIADWRLGLGECVAALPRRG
jgi:dTDP-4-dehydrorhamnose reductase